jgi:hypothetical protein
MKSNEVFLSFLILVLIIFSFYWVLRCRKCKKIKYRENYDLITKPDVSCRTQPVICPSGSYCPSTTGPSILCSPGYTCQTTGLTAQTICPAGSYCPSTTGPSIICPTGTFCPTTGMTKYGFSVGKKIILNNFSFNNGSVNLTNQITWDPSNKPIYFNKSTISIQQNYNQFTLKELDENGEGIENIITIPTNNSYTKTALANQLSNLLTNASASRSQYSVTVNSTSNNNLFKFSVTPQNSFSGASLIFNSKSPFNDLGFNKNIENFVYTSDNKYVLNSTNVDTQMFGPYDDINNSLYASRRNVLLNKINLSFNIISLVDNNSFSSNSTYFNLFIDKSLISDNLIISDLENTSMYTKSLTTSGWSNNIPMYTATVANNNLFTFEIIPSTPVNITDQSYIYLQSYFKQINISNVIFNLEIITT